jgi:hypothetical protein
VRARIATQRIAARGLVRSLEAGGVVSMSLAFVACVERGPLEDQVVLLARSIRRHAGRFRDAPIFTFQPRAGTAIAGETLDALRGLGVSHSTEPLNVRHADCPYANKVYACARAEETLAEDILVFVDSDTIFTAEPADLELPPGVDAAALPVCNRRLGSTGPGDPNEPYWQGLYATCGVATDARVTTVIDGERIRPYFNSGLVAVRRRSGLFTRWRADFEALLAAGRVPPSTGIDGMDEFSLAVILSRAIDRVRVLDLRYNYPLQWHERRLLRPPWREAQLEDLVHAHYRFYFTLPGYLEIVDPPLDPNGAVVRWLREYLPLKPLHPRFINGFVPPKG